MLPEPMVYGSYPELLSLKGSVDKRDYLRNLVANYLYKDILEILNISGVRRSPPAPIFSRRLYECSI
jgi:predicted AAA+ superfamily ATPase